MDVVLFDDPSRADLLPLTFTRPVAAIRVGILTIAEKWEKVFKTPVFYKTERELSALFPGLKKPNTLTLWINGKVCPDEILIKEIKNLQTGCALFSGSEMLAYKGLPSKTLKPFQSKTKATIIRFPYDIFLNNGREIESDFELLTKGKKSQLLSKTNRKIGKGKIFIEKGASVECTTLNTSNGSIYIGKNAVIMEGSLIRGPFALCDFAEVKMGAKIYGPTTIGPFSKVGGEINNSVIFGYSNKAHDGFLGNSVLGEWCNLGADTNNSNLKNNYSNVKLYNYKRKKVLDTGLQFCGLIMGDHSKTGINTQLNTGTVIGVSANVFGGDFPPTFIPSFSWGGAGGFETYRPEKAMEVAQKVKARRNLLFSKAEMEIFLEIFKLEKGEPAAKAVSKLLL